MMSHGITGLERVKKVRIGTEPNNGKKKHHKTFVNRSARRSINNQHNALNYITSLFNIQAPTCFGSSLPSSGSLSVPYELLEMQIK
jgi:hypothetical protein